jgi:hypothetical protein
MAAAGAENLTMVPLPGALSTASVPPSICVRSCLWLKLGGSALLGYFLYAVASHESNTMHWCSDTVSGTLMGLAIGNAVGAGFAKRAGILEGPAVAIAPLLSQHARGMALSFRL